MKLQTESAPFYFILHTLYDVIVMWRKVSGLLCCEQLVDGFHVAFRTVWTTKTAFFTFRF